jgi:hypothetical protein
MALYILSLSVEISFLARESISKAKRVVEDEINVTEAADHLRRIRQRDVACRLSTLHVEMLMKTVEGR